MSSPEPEVVEVAFLAVADGKQLGTATAAGGEVEATPGVAADTIAMLARRHRRTEAEVVALIARDGWSNGWASAS